MHTLACINPGVITIITVSSLPTSFALQTISEETGFKFSDRLQIFDARRKRFGIVVKSSERFHTQFKV